MNIKEEKEREREEPKMLGQKKKKTEENEKL